VVPAGAGRRATYRCLGRVESVTDANAVTRPGQGDLSVAEVFRANHLELVRLAALLVGDLATAEDVVQDVFARLQARPGRFAGLAARPPGAASPGAGAAADPLPYIRASVVNGCRSVHRRRRVAWRRAAAGDDPLRLTVAESAESAAIAAEERRKVLRALAALPGRRREVLVLRYYLGLSEAQIASVLGISHGTVKSTAARGLAALARVLGEEER
jgi:RNA polymerase sigma factor (sigma-70 family)